MILKLMILSSLYVYELIVTTSSLSSFRKPKSTLETPVARLVCNVVGKTRNIAGVAFQFTYMVMHLCK